VRCNDPRFKFTVPQGAKPLHQVPVTFTAGDTPGKVNITAQIQTAPAAAAPLEVPVQVQLVSPAAATPAGPKTF
jgi:hypothetical protein